MNDQTTAAGQALADIAWFARATFITSIIGVIIIAAGGAYTLHEYWSIKSALTTAAAKLEAVRGELATKFRPGR